MGVTIRSTNNIPKLKDVLTKLGKKEIKVGVFGQDNSEMVTIARANEFGVTIKPKQRKWLALPTKLARGKRPREFNDLKFILVNNRRALLVRETTGRRARSEIFFILVKSVNIPERSFLRAGFDKNVNRITRKMSVMLNDVFKFRVNPHVFVDMIGLEFSGLIQKELRDLTEPENAPLTVQNKRSNNPLIDTGRLVGSIRHEIE
jgi:hypothetical protein